MGKLVHLSLGSNIVDRENHLQGAIKRLEQFGHVLKVSSFYETEPVEFTGQPWFLNCAVALETSQKPEQLIAAILGTEQAMGRQRIQKKGPRVIDIDILLYDNIVMKTAGLTSPHPSMHERRFVLEPLVEIAPEVQHPVLKKTVRALLNELHAGQSVRKLERNSTG